MHQQLVEVNESPLLLLLDTSPPCVLLSHDSMYDRCISNLTNLSLCGTRPDMHDLPLRILEPVETVVVAGSRTQYVNIGYTLASLEAERIGVDHVVRLFVYHVPPSLESKQFTPVLPPHLGQNRCFPRSE